MSWSSPSSSSPSPSSLHPRPADRASVVRRVLLLGTCAGLMAGAFVAATHVEGPTAHAAPPAPPPLPSVGTHPASAPAPATAVASAPATPSTATTGAAATTRAMPDLKGKRLTVAMREARKLGIRLVASDEDGYRPDPEEASAYRVRRQSIAAGQDVPAAAAVKVTVRPTGASLGGY